MTAKVHDKSRQRSADSIAEEFQISIGINVSTKIVQQELCGMVSTAKCWMDCGVMNHASLLASKMGESGFGGCQENIICLTEFYQL